MLGNLTQVFLYVINKYECMGHDFCNQIKVRPK